MSLVFSNSSLKSGIVELIYSITGADTTRYPLAEVVRDVNSALDKVFSLIFKSDGRWQFDDSNQTDYPIITTNLVSGQRDYSFSTDQTGNLILDIYKVQVKVSASGPYRDIYPVDQQRFTLQGDNNIQAGVAPTTMTDGNNGGGVPTCYDKTGNGIFLDLIPNYNATAGLRVFINREGSYFSASDTTKKPGFAGLFHEYLALRPAYQFAYRKGLQNMNSLHDEMLRMEMEIIKYYGNREKDMPNGKRMSVRIESDK